MKSLVYFLTGLSLLQLTLAQVLEAGTCNKNVKTMGNFEPSKYMGIWYENEKYPFIFEVGGKCIQAEYQILDGGEISVVNSNINQLTGLNNSIKGTARIVENAKLKVKFDNMPTFVREADYWVLETDYDNFAVVYSCTEIGGLVNGKVVWILTRKRQTDEKYIELAKDVIKKNGLSLKPLYKTDQNGCE